MKPTEVSLAADSGSEALAALRPERDLYLRPLHLGSRNRREPFLDEALGLIVELTGARLGYREIRGEGEDLSAQWWSMSRGCSSGDIDDIRSALSRGIIAEALPPGQTVMTPSAVLDPRFRARESVGATPSP